MHSSGSVVLLVLLALASVSVTTAVLFNIPDIDYAVSPNSTLITDASASCTSPSSLVYHTASDSLLALCQDGRIQIARNVTTTASPASSTLTPLTPAAGCNISSISLYFSTLYLVCTTPGQVNTVSTIDLSVAVDSQSATPAFLNVGCTHPQRLYGSRVTCSGGAEGSAVLVEVGSHESYGVIYTTAQCANLGPVSLGSSSNVFECDDTPDKNVYEDYYGTITKQNYSAPLTSKTTFLSTQGYAATIFAGNGGVVMKYGSTVYVLATKEQCNNATFLLQAQKFDLLFAICGDKSVVVVSMGNASGRWVLGMKTIVPAGSSTCTNPTQLTTTSDGLRVLVACAGQGILMFSITIGVAGSADNQIVTLQPLNTAGTPTCGPFYDSLEFSSKDGSGRAVLTCYNQKSVVRMNLTMGGGSSAPAVTSASTQQPCQVVRSIPSVFYPNTTIVLCDDAPTAVGRLDDSGTWTALLPSASCPTVRQSVLEDPLDGTIYVGCQLSVMSVKTDLVVRTVAAQVSGAYQIADMVLRGKGSGRQLVVTSDGGDIITLSTGAITPIQSNYLRLAFIDPVRDQTYFSTPYMSVAAIQANSAFAFSVMEQAKCPAIWAMTLDQKTGVIYLACQLGFGGFSLIAVYQPRTEYGQSATSQILGWNVRGRISGVAAVDGGVLIHTVGGLEFAPFNATAFVAQVLVPAPSSSSSSTGGSSSSSSSSSSTSSTSSSTSTSTASDSSTSSSSSVASSSSSSLSSSGTTSSTGSSISSTGGSSSSSTGGAISGASLPGAVSFSLLLLLLLVSCQMFFSSII